MSGYGVRKALRRWRMRCGEQVTKAGFWLLLPGQVSELSESLELGTREYLRIHANDNSVSLADILAMKDGDA